MEYKIVNRNQFSIIGKSIQVSCKDGEGMKRIPEFWYTCQADGTIERLTSLCPGKDILGIKMDFDEKKEQFTYVIAVEGIAENLGNDLIFRDIPASTWAVFPSIGPLPKAIQDVWQQIFPEWFQTTGYQHAKAPELEVCPLGDTTANNYRCEIWIPVVEG